VFRGTVWCEPRNTKAGLRTVALSDFAVATLLAGSTARIASSAEISVVSKLLGHALAAIAADVDGHLIGTVASDA
jgi:hypothetical protein